MRNFKFLLIALMGIALASCQQEETQTEFYLHDLQGKWLEDKTEHFIRFTDEQSDMAGYLWGREWHEDEDDYEENLMDPERMYGNGWFKYQLEIKGDLHEIHFMDNGGAEIPKEYIVTLLTDTKMTYHEKDMKKKYHFTKQ